MLPGDDVVGEGKFGGVTVGGKVGGGGLICGTRGQESGQHWSGSCWVLWLSFCWSAVLFTSANSRLGHCAMALVDTVATSPSPVPSIPGTQGTQIR